MAEWMIIANEEDISSSSDSDGGNKPAKTSKFLQKLNRLRELLGQLNVLNANSAVYLATSLAVPSLSLMKIGNKMYLVDEDTQNYFLAVQVPADKIDDPEVFFFSGKKNYAVKKQSNVTETETEKIYLAVKNMFGLENDDNSYWSIKSVDNNLALVTYNDKAVNDNSSKDILNKYGKYRGILIDYTRQVIIASSYHFTPTLRIDPMSTFKVEDNKLLISSDKKTISYPVDEQLVIMPYLQGRVIRVSWWDGKAHYSSHNNANAERAYRRDVETGNKINYVQMFNDAGGPSPSLMFDTSKRFSVFCYVFMIVHPVFLGSSRHLTKNPYCVFMFKHRIIDDEQVERLNNLDNGLSISRDAFELEDKNFSLPTVKKLAQEMPTPTNGEPIGTLAIDSYDVETAKNHLVNGFFKIESPNSDYRQRLGEALIVYRRTGEKNTIEDMIMVSSDSYYYREQMIGEKGIDIDVSFQMRLLAKQARLSFRNEEAKNSFLAKFVLYRDIAKDWADNDFLTSLNDRKFLYTWNSFYNVSDKNLDLVEERIKIASYNLLICLPATLQKKHALVLDNYLKEINNLKFWIISLRNSYSSYRFLGKRIPQMIQAAAKESNFTNAITRYLNNENEASLSAMLRIHREYHTQTSPEAPIGQNSPIEGKDKKKRIKIVKKDKKMSDDKKSSEQGVIRPMINFE